MTILRFIPMTIALLCYAAAASAQAVRVEVQQTTDGWQLVRDREPYYIHGVGGADLPELARSFGSNSFRIWGTGPETKRHLDRAQELGLTVTVGIWLEHRSQGGKYDDPGFREAQRIRVREQILKYKDHPALLMWCIGNESEVNQGEDYWKHLNELARLAKTLDPDHPVMTAVAEIGEAKAKHLLSHAPDLDVLGVNSYRGLFSLRQRLEKLEIALPIVITEYAANGQWETARTAYGAPISQTSTQKAAQIARVYQNQILGNPNCLGSYVFRWELPPDASATWFPLITWDQKPSEIVDTLQRMWTGSWPTNLGPKILSISSEADGAVLSPGETFEATIDAIDPDGDPITIQWELFPDRQKRDPDFKPATHAELIQNISGADRPTCQVSAPMTPGLYRLHVRVQDTSEKTATADIPFKVGIPGEAKPNPAPNDRDKNPQSDPFDPENPATS